jgi:pimeloyl-ACP methyl ester carboxylesterase
MPTVELAAGAVEYGDTGGSGPPLVLLHGLAMDGRVWDGVIGRLGGGFRCLTPGSRGVPRRCRGGSRAAYRSCG